MRKKTVPVEGFGRVIPGPIGFFRIREDDARIFIQVIRLGPNVKFRAQANQILPGAQL